MNVQTPVVIAMRWLFNSRGEQHGRLSARSLLGLCHPILVSSRLKMTCLMMDVSVSSRMGICSQWKASFLKKSFHFTNQR